MGCTETSRAEVDLTGKPEYIIDGDKFSTIDEFAAHFTQVVGDEGRLFEWDGGASVIGSPGTSLRPRSFTLHTDLEEDGSQNSSLSD